MAEPKTNDPTEPVFSVDPGGGISVQYRAYRENGTPVSQQSYFHAETFLGLCRKIIEAHKEATLAIERLKIKLGKTQVQKGKE